MLKRSMKVLLAGSLLACGAAQADLSYTYAEIGYGNTELDFGNDDVDGDGFLLGGSIAVSDQFYVFADFDTADFDDDVDLSRSKVGLGLNYGIADNIDLIGRVAWVKFEVDTPIGDADEDGFGLDVGLRGALTETFELEGAVEYVDLGDDGGDDTSLVGEGRYFFTPTFSLGGRIEVGDDVTMYGILARLNF